MAFQATECGPSNIYGPYKHHLFLGCSVVSFSASVGFNEQVSELTVSLVEDPCEAPSTHPKIYYDGNLNRLETLAADPGFFSYGAGGNSSPQIGTAVFFRVESGTVGDPNYRAFEFSGLLQSWESSNKIDGKNSYSVKIVDPRQILEGAQVIINDYSGAVPSAIYNLFNVYGYLEWYGDQDCPNTETGGFGGSEASPAGIPYNNVLKALPVLTSQFPISGDIDDYSPHGRLRYRFDSTSGCGVISSDGTYLLDISELPSAPDYFRLSGTNISIMELITQICQESGCDYYIELIPVQSGGGVYKFIKVRVIDRGDEPPNYDAISNFIGSSDNGVIDSTFGREARNETTSALLIGGNKQAIFTRYTTFDADSPPVSGAGSSGISRSWAKVEEDSDILPYWGVDGDGNIIKTYINTDTGQNFITLTPSIINILNESLNIPISTDPWGDERYIRVEMLEFRHAIVDKNTWFNYAETAFHWMPEVIGGPNGDGKVGTDLYEAMKQAYGFTGKLANFDQQKAVTAAQNLVKDGLKSPAMCMNFVKLKCQDRFKKQFDEDLETVHKFINDAASEFYGKKFIVKVDETCVKYDPDDYTKLLYSEMPSEGGWPWTTQVQQESLDPINGAEDSILEALRLEDGRVGPFLTFSLNNDRVNVQKLTEDFLYDSTNGFIFAKCSVEPDFVFENFATREGVYVIIVMPNTIDFIENSEEDVLRRMQGLAMLSKNEKIPQATRDEYEVKIKNLQATLTSNAVKQKIGLEPAFPLYAAVPLKSTTLTYGPWYVGGTPGLIRVEKDEGLTPWDYGGIEIMEDAANARITAGVTNMTAGETGSITVAGYPVIPLGAELGANTGIGATNLVETRALSSDDVGFGAFQKFDTDPWTGIFGPNITSISVSIAIGGVTTTYQMRTFTPQFGKFNKYLADRLKTVGPQMRKQQHQTLLKGIGRYQKGYKNLGFVNPGKL